MWLEVKKPGTEVVLYVPQHVDEGIAEDPNKVPTSTSLRKRAPSSVKERQFIWDFWI